jgi:hypothetical protein
MSSSEEEDVVIVCLLSGEEQNKKRRAKILDVSQYLQEKHDSWRISFLLTGCTRR